MAPLDSSSKSRILVTGADGFVGHHIIKQILDNTPHQVEATVQTSEDSFRLQSVHLQHPRLTMHVVPDVAKPRSFVQAAQHCHAIIHLASPPLAQSRDNEESILIPALQSVQAIAHAANSNNSVRRLVYCSSFAAMFDPSPQGSSPSKTYTEKDWNPTTYDQAENAPGIMLAYQASKALAEKELERLCSEQDRWDLVSICPGVVFGAPVEGSVDSVAELARSNPIIWSLFNKEKLPPTSVPVWTSVTSLAEAHVSALSAPKAGGERFFLVNGTYDNQELADLLNSSDLVGHSKSQVPKGNPGHHDEHWKADGSKAIEYLEYSKPQLRETLLELRNYLLLLEGRHSSSRKLSPTRQDQIDHGDQ